MSSLVLLLIFCITTLQVPTAMATLGRLRIVKPSEVVFEKTDPVDAKAREQAAALMKEVKEGGFEGLLDVAVRLRDVESKEAKVIYSREDLKVAFENMSENDRNVIKRTAERVKKFAQEQRNSIKEMTTDIPGGKAGHYIAPMETAGCYAPGGRYPLPSSVIMTAVTARAAGVKNVWVASPRPAPATLAAAYIAEADGLLAIGGAQAIGALAYGCGVIPPCDIIVGPGNKWVTAAKSLVNGICAIDMLAGPSEVLIIADDSCDPNVVAADLIAQAEHDTEARPILVCTSLQLANKVNDCLAARLENLSTREVAYEAMKKGYACVCDDIATCVSISDSIGPEHLEIHTQDALAVSKTCSNYGGIFIGQISAEVLGDYGVGPNHVLPTCGTSKYTGGLSVFTFLRIRTWMNIESKAAAQDVIRDCVALARLEGLEGHAQAGECRLVDEPDSKRQKH